MQYVENRNVFYNCTQLHIWDTAATQKDWNENLFFLFYIGHDCTSFGCFRISKTFEEQVVTRQLLGSCLSRSPSKSLCECSHFLKQSQLRYVGRALEKVNGSCSVVLNPYVWMDGWT